MRLSLGSAAKLGLTKADQLVEPTTCYIMVGSQCTNSCAFCSQSVDASSLSRIRWPEFNDELVIHKVNRSSFKRVCLQCTSVGIAEAAELIDRFEKPVSISYNFQSMEEVDRASCADRICIPLDAASAKVYEETKQGDFTQRLELLAKATEKYPGKISTHLIIGLGESEKEAVAILKHLHSLGISVGLFAFTPVPETKMEAGKQPDIKYYRRMQALNYSLMNGPAGTKAYETSGCESCNRPYYNERPGGIIYNYPRPLTDEEYHEINQ